MKKHPIALIFPRTGTKPRIVLASLMNEGAPIDWKSSLVVYDAGDDTELTRILSCQGISGLPSAKKDLSDVAHAITSRAPDFLVCCGWGHKIPPDILKIPTIAALNCHSSYLPDYKGSSVYRHYWANLEPYGGATIHLMTERFDAGNVIRREKFRIFTHDTPESILYRASELTAPLLREAIMLCASGYTGEPHHNGRYFLKIGRKKLFLHRCFNRIANFFGISRWLTPHR